MIATTRDIPRHLHIKKEIRILGLDDGPFGRGDKETLVVGVVLRAKEYVDGILSTTVAVDGLDATQKIIWLVKKSRHFDQLRAILLNGIAFGGFNIFDIQKIARVTGKIVIVVIKKKPDLKKFKAAMKTAKLTKMATRLKMIEAAGPIYETTVRGKKIFYQAAGILPEDAAKLLQKTSVRSAVPEAIRLAHMISSGIVEGESRGKP